MSSRSWFWSALVLIATASPGAAQAPSPLDLVPGIREAGMPDLALEYLKEIEGKLSPEEKKLVQLERAKCLLDAAEDEPDEGTRTSMVNEAKEGFNSFLTTNAAHLRASEASLALARLTSIEAKAQLNRARRMDIPPKDEAGHDAAVDKQRQELAKARPMFLNASKRFADAATQIKAQLDALPAGDPARNRLTRESFDADLASAINEYYLADTYLVTGAASAIERDPVLEKAREKFEKLAKGPQTSRTVWIAKAWMAEVLGDQGKHNDMKTEFDEILRIPRAEAAEGKRLVRFFQVRRAYIEALQENNPSKLNTVELTLRRWLADYGNMAKPTPEVIAARYYLAFSLQRQGMIAIAKITPDKNGRINLPSTAQSQFEQAEKLYRALSQTDHDYTDRSAKYRMYVVRRLLGEADKPVTEYPTFEAAQMASLIQMAKLNDNQKLLDKARDEDDNPDAPFWVGCKLKANTLRLEADVQDRKLRVVALLERARELATDRDTPADVTDNLLRLVYFYQTTDQPHQAAILGEHIARTIRTTGGKGAIAGLMSLNGYTIASQKIKAKASEDAMEAEALAAAVTAARRSDRERAIQVAKFLDEKFPNDTATDSARHRLAILYNDEGKPDMAFEAIIKIRPGYTGLLNARQMEGFLAASLINPKEGVVVTADRKKVVYGRAVGDLSRINKPGPNATREDVRGYVSCRLRLAFLFLTQNRADPETEKTTPGYQRALEVADELIAVIPTFDICIDKEKKLTIDGMELGYQANDIRTRSLYLRAKTLVDEKKFNDAADLVGKAIEDVSKGQLYDDKMKKWLTGPGDAGDEESVAQQKAKIAGLAQGIDRIRRDIVMVGFKLRCVQGDKDGATKMLEDLKKAGGGIETNKDSLELMARELAAHISELRKEAKALENKPEEAKSKLKEATDLGLGLGVLLKEFTSLKDLPVATIMFLGQTFYTIGEWDNAIAEFKKIPPPNAVDWDKRKLEDFPKDDRNRISKEIREYRFAQLYIAKAYVGGAKFAEAEALLRAAIGDNAKQGYAYSSLDFRKELARMHEAKAATIAVVKDANTEWGKSLREWTTLFQFAQAALKQIKPDSPPEQVKMLKSNFYDAYYEVQRVMVTANTQLIKDPAKLASSIEGVGKKIIDLENIHKFNEPKMAPGPDGKPVPVTVPGPDGKPVPVKAGVDVINNEVWTHYCDLLDKNPQLKATYKNQNGKFFLERPKAD